MTQLTVSTRNNNATPQLTKQFNKNVSAIIENVVADKSDGTRRKYEQRLAHLVNFVSHYDGALDKRLLGAYRRELASGGLSASAVNGYLSAARLFWREAGELGLIDERVAERVASIENVAERGQRLGRWLSPSEALTFLNLPDGETLKGKRDRAILAVALFCGLRRSELASLTVGHLQTRDGHNVIVNLLGKHGRTRNIKMPVGVRRVVDEWLSASGRKLSDASLLFVAMRKGGHIAEGERITTQAFYKLVREYAAAVADKLGRDDLTQLAPHDLRRTFAKLARRGGATLESVSLELGHSSLATTQRYLGEALDLDNSSSDAVSSVLKWRIF